MNSLLAAGLPWLATLAAAAQLAAAPPWAQPIPSSGHPAPRAAAPAAGGMRLAPPRSVIRPVAAQQPTQDAAPITTHPVAAMPPADHGMVISEGGMYFSGPSCQACCGIANVGLWADYCRPREPWFKRPACCPPQGECGCTASHPATEAPAHHAGPPRGSAGREPEQQVLEPLPPVPAASEAQRFRSLLRK